MGRTNHPLTIGMLVAFMLVSAAASVESAQLEESDCDADRQAIIDELAAGRAQAVKSLGRAIAQASTAYERTQLEQQREELWDYEEQQMAVADRVRRDCLKHVKQVRSGSG